MSEPAERILPSPRAAIFEPLEEIGRGGMGVVYRARQRNLGRDVALKVLQGDGANARAAFVSEALTIGGLSHPNILPVYELCDASRLAMKLVRGRDWEHRLRAEPAAGIEHLEILLEVCNACRFAHSRGIVHLDLKPANVLLGMFGEVLLLDWGLAAALGPSDVPIRQVDTIVDPCGTPCYMAPELALADSSAIGTATDVYLLGGILFRILSGRPPHAGATFHQVLLTAVRGEVPVLGDEHPQELRQLCRDALAALPAERPTLERFQTRLREALAHRQSRSLCAAARKTLARGVALRRQADATLSMEVAARSCYRELTRAVAGFRQAGQLWPGNPESVAGETRARSVLAEVAVQNGDLQLVEAQLEQLNRLDASSLELRRRLQNARQRRRREKEARSRLRLALRGSVALLVIGALLWLSLLLVKNHTIAASRSELEGQGRHLVASQSQLSEQTAQIVEQTEEIETGSEQLRAYAAQLKRLIDVTRARSIVAESAIARTSDGIRTRILPGADPAVRASALMILQQVEDARRQLETP